MGIDPGIANTGFGVVRVAGARMTAIDGGTVEVPTGVPVEQRLRRIHDSIVELIEWHEPQSLALESIYFGKNVSSAIGVGQARGVVMLAAAVARDSPASTTRRNRSSSPSAGPVRRPRIRSSTWSASC